MVVSGWIEVASSVVMNISGSTEAALNSVSKWESEVISVSNLGFIEVVITSVTESIIEVISGFTEVVSAVGNDNSGSVEVFTNSVKESANMVVSGWIEVASSVVISSSSSEVAINSVKESAGDGIS